ncbi:Rne/Rng family ribonuclease [Brevundimonas sp.]|uniref:Rne/Rng family ribonuclease n=1 Tax=Brevundimonas sp. TaxID=1871086 RepID=UPI001DF835D2|nr:Rne/Rng family ribonuclease [Brevundimonas sp.]MBA4000726.1 ribonuclease E/G [Brevundimonas sp.]
MSKTMLIDAAHAEETRVAIVDGRQVEEFDFESKARRQLRGNIYLAKVTRVEPSLQAAFVEYGGNRHGFLAFNEIHPDYYQIPVADREAIMAETDDDGDEHLERESADDESEGGPAEEERLKRRLMRRYKIQDVIKRRQILLVQVVKDERGAKGAALTTWLSLAGRYCVLMPNTGKGGGISRKITQATDRKRLKAAAAALEVPKGMGLIIRTAGAKRTKAEIKRDYEYLLRLWETIRETTLNSNAPSLIYEEENLVRRAVRDMFDKDFDGIQVEGEEGWREARDFMRVLMPSQAKKVHLYKGSRPLFAAQGIEDILHQIHQPVVPLKSGGYLVINQTEALVAIDVNSGRATKERNVEQTAYKTNLEAAVEAARQLRLRDLAGLVVIDFIDMDEAKNNRSVEKVLKDALSTDRARVQMGKISIFGLMEISRQRRRIGVLEGATEVCPHCQGAGRIRSVESAALMALRLVDIEAGKGGAGAINLRLCTAVALYVLNHKRAHLSRLEEQRGLFVNVIVDDSLAQSEHVIERTETNEDFEPPYQDKALPSSADDVDDLAVEDDEDEDEYEDDDSEETEAPDQVGGERTETRDENDGNGEGRGRRRRRRRRGGRGGEDDESGAAPAREDDAFEAAGNDDEGGRRRRRGRRGGRRAREEGDRDAYTWVRGRTPSVQDPYVWFNPLDLMEGGHPERSEQTERPERGDERTEKPARPRRSREEAARARAASEGMTPEEAKPYVEPDTVPAPVADAVEAPKRRRVRRKPAADVAGEALEVTIAEPAVEEALADSPQAAPEPAPEPVRPQVQAAPEPEPVVAPEPEAKADIAAIIEADDAQIQAPPAKPKRGWWRR